MSDYDPAPDAVASIAESDDGAAPPSPASAAVVAGSSSIGNNGGSSSIGNNGGSSSSGHNGDSSSIGNNGDSSSIGNNGGSSSLAYTHRELGLMGPLMLLWCPDGSDITASITHFSDRRGVGLFLLSACGAVSSAILEKSAIDSAHCEIVSMSGVLPPPALPSEDKILLPPPALSLWTPSGLVMGRVAGPVIASGPVVLAIHTFHSVLKPEET